LSGERSLVTQRGLLQISPGDFVRIPQGVAFTSIHAAPNAYLRLAATHAIPQVAKGTKHATELDSGELGRLRAAVTG
jgi:homogentisate 1,2-dioxygenase